MSTIHAVVDWQTGFDEQILNRMLSGSHYWLPDLERHRYLDGSPSVGLAKASLFNRPLSELDSIIVNQTETVYLVSNAHLDNRQQLATELGIDASALCDGEIILNAYEQWGGDTASHLLGDFVFIIWDKNKKELYCARDHFGVKSLFYIIQNSRVILSNEHQSLLVDGLFIEKNIKKDWLKTQFLPLAGNEFLSPFESISTLPAGHQMIVNGEQHVVSPYWSLESKPLPVQSDKEYLFQLKKLLTAAVERRLVSGYPLAAELSEGLDSNAVVGYASEQLNPKTLFTMSFDGVELNEQNEKAWRPVYQEIFDAMTLWPNVKPLWLASCAPIQKSGAHSEHFGGPSSMSSWFDSRCMLASEQGCRTILSGWGGDHCVSGYGDEYVYELFSQGKLLTLYQHLRARQKRGRGGHPMKSFILITLETLFPKLYKLVTKKRNHLRTHLNSLVLNSILQDHVNPNATQLIERIARTYQRHSVKERDYSELISVGVQSRITSTEICARRYRCEFRYPLLDKELIEFAYNLPSHLKSKNGVERFMFRELLKGKTTERIRLRVKADVLTPDNSESIKQEVEQYLKDVNKYWTAEFDSMFNHERLIELCKTHPHVALRYLQTTMSIQKHIRTGNVHL
ncbi:asparagine synthetase B family protein [Shewanella basaltis]|uniref:asparagine synthetase B family protein n=1 Tax=Shewanella basaltis TaxID=472183 RepID=UPI003AAA82E0